MVLSDETVFGKFPKETMDFCYNYINDFCQSNNKDNVNKNIFCNIITDKERAFYNTKNKCFKNFTIKGKKNGKSAFKECRNITVEDSNIFLNNNFWHCYNLNLYKINFELDSKDPIWYCKNTEINNSKILSSKACRNCINMYIKDSYINSEDFCWKSDGIKFENCKIGYENGNCEKCKNEFYLNRKDNLCYSNSEQGPFYKCASSDYKGEKCTQCIDDYYLGYLDDKCTTIDGCDLSENENKCLECDEYYTLNLKDNRCYSNEEIDSEENKFYFRCNRTNKEGTKCEICLEDYVLNENGLCIDEEHCTYKEGGVCKGCLNDGNTYCLNNYFGCVEIYSDNCMECNQILDLSNCTKCEPGYVLNEYSQCEEP